MCHEDILARDLYEPQTASPCHKHVEEKFGEQNFRVLSEMRILAKIRVAILDLVGYVYFLTKFDAKSDFRV